jgi:hypothetical protein
VETTEETSLEVEVVRGRGMAALGEGDLVGGVEKRRGRVWKVDRRYVCPVGSGELWWERRPDASIAD